MRIQLGKVVSMIDAVITWVDGADPAHRARRDRFADGSVHADAKSQTRFFSSGEVRFAVLSLLHFCPFVRHIHVVTDEQYPDILRSVLEDQEKVRIVDHRDVFGEHADLLPVFSSRSIETMIHRIPGLAEHFLYLNDDIFVGRPMRPEDYFDGDVPILRAALRRFPNPMLQWLKSRLRCRAAGRGAADGADRHLPAGRAPAPSNAAINTGDILCWRSGTDTGAGGSSLSICGASIADRVVKPS